MSVSLYYGKELPSRQPVQLSDSSPFRILVLADLGASKPTAKPLSVDRDELDDVIGRLGVHAKLQLQENGPVVDLAISSMEDFHPDHLFKNMELFDALRSRRKRLANAQTFAEEMKSIRATKPTPEAPADSANKTEAPSPESGNLLDQAVDLAQARQAPLEEQVMAGTIDWDDYVKQLVSPYLVAKADPKQAEMLANIDETIAEAMRHVLHHPKFQQLEATWTGIQMLTRRLDTGRRLQIAVCDLSRHSLTDDIAATEDLAQSQLYKLLVKQPDEEQVTAWTLVIGDYQFGSDEDDLNLLGRIAKVCASAGSAFVAGATSEIAGCPSFGTAPDPDDWTPLTEEIKTAWKALRGLPEANHLSLALPRILARRPYGKETDPIESFSFTEIPDGTMHDNYLWMNAAFGIALVLGQTYSEQGWGLSRMMEGELDRLPTHYYEDEGEESVKACAEAYVVDRAAEKLSAMGLTVARSVRNDGAVRFERIKSISSAAPDLCGYWS